MSGSAVPIPKARSQYWRTTSNFILYPPKCLSRLEKNTLAILNIFKYPSSRANHAIMPDKNTWHGARVYSNHNQYSTMVYY